MDRALLPLQLAALVFVATALGWLMPDAVSALAAAALMGAAAAGLAWRGSAGPEGAGPGEPEDAPQDPPEDPEDPDARAERLRAVRHDLRGALSPILLLSGQLAEADDERTRRAAATIAGAVDRATETLRLIRP